jgi:hypothetical protein
MKRRVMFVLAVALALVLPASAQAALPKTGDTLIVPAKSLGGVALGGSPAAVVKAWGKTSSCSYQCLYEGKNSGELGSVLLESDANGQNYKVWSVFIAVSQTIVGSTTKPNFNTPLTKFKTAKGIGLGSSLKELRQAYRAVKKVTTTYYELGGPKESSTTFLLSAAGRIESIAVRSHPGG